MDVKYVIKIFPSALRGVHLVRKYCKKNQGEKIVFNTLGGIGDTCIMGAYLHEYEKNCPQPCKVVTLDKTKWVLQEMGFTNVEQANLKQILDIKHAFEFPFTRLSIERSMNRGKILIADPWYYLRWSMRFMPGVHAIDILRYACYGLYDDCPITYPHPNVNEEEVLQKYAIQGDFCVINPYSNSMSVNFSVFEKLAAWLKEKGMQVYTNVVGKQKAVQGTLPLPCSMNEMYAIAKYAKMFISIRSGLLDYIIGNLSNVAVLYDKNQYFHLYSLKAWNKQLNLCEIAYDENVDVVGKIEKQFGESLK